MIHIVPSAHPTRGVHTSGRARLACAAAGLACAAAIAGCHHAPVRAVVVPALPAPTDSPVMVSVPPPTHRSTPEVDTAETVSGIPVVKAVPPPKKRSRRTDKSTTSAPALTSTTTSPAVPAPTQAQPAPTATQTLGQLTTDTDSSAATRESAGQAVRAQRDRLSGLSTSVQTANSSQIEQIRRFVKAAVDAWDASDYAAAMTLATKAKVLLDDLPK